MILSHTHNENNRLCTIDGILSSYPGQDKNRSTEQHLKLSRDCDYKSTWSFRVAVNTVQLNTNPAICRGVEVSVLFTDKAFSRLIIEEKESDDEMNCCTGAI